MLFDQIGREKAIIARPQIPQAIHRRQIEDGGEIASAEQRFPIDKGGGVGLDRLAFFPTF